MSSLAGAPSFLLKSEKSTGIPVGGKTPEEKRSDALRNFQSRFREVHPLLIKAMDPENRKDPQKRVANLVRLQEDSIKRVLKQFGIIAGKSEDVHANYSSLASDIAISISQASQLKGFRQAAGYTAKIAANSIDDQVSDLNTESKDQAFLSDDAVVNIKINTVRPALAFFQTLSSLGFDQDSIDDAMKTQIDVATSMAKDLCFNHEPKASLWDRERLFVALIAPCMESVQDAWLSLASKNADGEIRVKAFTPSALSGHLKSTREAIQSDDMGHEDHIENTLEELSQGVFHYLHIGNNLGVSPLIKQKLIAHQLEIIDNHLSSAWNLAADGIREYVENLDEAALEAWIEAEGSKPMNLSKVWDLFDSESLIESLSKGMPLDVDQKELVGESFYRLIQAWGLTDTLCGQS